KMERMAVSLPAGRPAGQLTTLPTSPLAARASITGMAACWRGVWFCSWGTGLSAMPSPMMRMYFMGSRGLLSGMGWVQRAPGAAEEGLPVFLLLDGARLGLQEV